MRAGLLQLAFAEAIPVIAHRIGHCIAQSASSEAWPELLPTVCAEVGQGGARACTALFILEQLPDYAPEVPPLPPPPTHPPTPNPSPAV